MDLIHFIIKVFTIFIASFMFCIAFKIKGINMLFASIGGMLGTTVYISLSFFTLSSYFNYIIAGFFISSYCEIMARIRKTPVTVFLVISIIPLVPGSNAYYMMEYIILKDYYMAANQGVEMIGVAGSIAFGLFIAASIIRFIPLLYPRKNI